MQIDQDPGSYRVQASDGSWHQRVNKPLCRWMGIIVMAFLGLLAFQVAGEGANPMMVLFPAGMAFCAGALVTLSLKSLNW